MHHPWRAPGRTESDSKESLFENPLDTREVYRALTTTRSGVTEASGDSATECCDRLTCSRVSPRLGCRSRQRPARWAQFKKKRGRTLRDLPDRDRVQSAAAAGTSKSLPGRQTSSTGSLGETSPTGFIELLDQFGHRGVRVDDELRPASKIMQRRRMRIDTQIFIQRRKNFAEVDRAFAGLGA
jgi:hypothetical protein